MAGNYSSALRAHYANVNAELGSPALFYLGLMANPDTVDSKCFSFIHMTTTNCTQLLGPLIEIRLLRK
jgi:hypothetical protein